MGSSDDEQTIKENRIVPLVMLFPHERNYRQHPESQIKKLMASLQRFGQGRSIVVQSCKNGSYTIVAGHGVVEAAQQLGYSELRADILPEHWSQEQITGYLVADNLHAQDAIDNEEILAHLLQEQQDAGFDLASVGSDDETLRQMLESLGDEYLGSEEGTPDVQFKEYDESLADDLDNEMCQQCGKLCLKSGKGKK